MLPVWLSFSLNFNLFFLLYLNSSLCAFSKNKKFMRNAIEIGQCGNIYIATRADSASQDELSA